MSARATPGLPRTTTPPVLTDRTSTTSEIALTSVKPRVTMTSSHLSSLATNDDTDYVITNTINATTSPSQVSLTSVADVNFSITNVTDSSRRVSTARQPDKFTSVQLSLGNISTTSVTSAITTSPGVITSRSSHVVASTATATSGGGGGAGMSARESTAEAAMTSTEALVAEAAALPAIIALTVAVSVGLIVIALLLFLPWIRAKTNSVRPLAASRQSSRDTKRSTCRRSFFPLSWTPSRRTVPPTSSIFGSGYDNMGLDEEDVEMTVVTDVFEVPAERQSRPVHVIDLMEYMRRHQNDKSLYRSEFASLPSKKMKSCNEAQLPIHANKNRYRDALPYNENRVKLSSANEEHCMYINASYIDGYGKKMAYIATQGPVAATFADFWEMVWQQNSNRIAMVTNLEEDGREKCSRYWPQMEQRRYGDVTVQSLQEQNELHWIRRTFQLTKGFEKRQVTQFQFTAWPDQEVPDSCTSVLKYRDVVFGPQQQQQHADPVIVHCSAGVGRTGTLIAIDYLLNQAACEKQVDILACVDNLRRQRMSSVQNVAQYMFIHNTLLEKLLLGNVVFPCSQFETEFFHLCHPFASSDVSELQLQYDVLEILKPETKPLMFSKASDIQNRLKNRSSDILPMDNCIPFLRPISGFTDTYINAVFVPTWSAGMTNRAGQVVTQLPLSDTVTDMWRLVRDEMCACVVMLNQPDDPDCTYLPTDGGSLSVGPFTISVTGQLTSDGVCVTDLQVVCRNVTESGDDAQRSSATVWSPLGLGTFSVRHVCPLTWPTDQPFPSDNSTLLQLAHQVSLVRRRAPDANVLVQCTYGCQRSGLFTALLNVLDLVQREAQVDVFNAIKLVRQSRPQFITDAGQFRYLYELVASYLATDRELTAYYVDRL